MKKLKKYSQRIFAVLLSAVFALCLSPANTVKVMAATTGRQEEWMAWAPGKTIDVDGNGVWCVDVAASYSSHIFGVNPLGGGNAEYKYANSNGAYFQKIPYDKNNPGNVPRRGDIVVWRGGGQHAGLGHIAVVLSANQNQMYVLHQTHNKPVVAANIPYYQSWANGTKSNICTGWLRPRPEKIIGGGGSTAPGTLEDIGGYQSVTEITSTGARIQFNYGGRYNISHYGFFIGENPNNLTKVTEDIPANNIPYIFYYLGTGKWTSALKPGTTYYYKFYSTLNGTYRESKAYNFTTLPIAPTSAALTVSKNSAIVGDTLIFKAGGNNQPTNYTIGIDKGSQRILTQEMPNGVLSIDTLPVGKYTAYVTASNSAGGKDSARISFRINSRSVPFQLAVLRTGNAACYKTGQTVALAARAKGGTAPYRYQFYVVSSDGSKVVLRNYAFSNVFRWKPTTPGTYRVGVNVVDARNRVVNQVRTVKVERQATTSSLRVAVFRTGWKSTYKAGETVALAARGEGGIKPYRYRFYVYRSNGTKVVLRNYSSSNVFRWKPRTPDTYRVCVAIKDARGSVIAKTLYTTIR